MKTLITNATVVTVDPRGNVHERGAVAVEGTDIVDVGPSDAVCARHPDADRTVAADGMALLPGFVSAHNHLGYAVFRGRAEDIGYDATHRLYLPMAAILTRGERQAVGNHAIAELLRGGVTTVLEMEEDADVFGPFIEESGIRAGLGIMLSDLDLEGLARGELAFDAAARERQLGQATDLLDTWHGRAEGRIQGYLAATGISTGSKALLGAIREEADRRGLRISVHLGFGEKALVRQAHGREQLDVAEEAGLLADDVVAVHCYELDAGEVSRLAASGAHLAHCPLMNQFRGEVAPIQDLRAGGMNVGLGIDNYFSDYFDVLRACIASARIRARDPRVLSAREVLALGTIDAARAMGLDGQVGSIEVGKRADLQLVDLRRSGLTPVNDPVATLVYHAHAKDVHTVMVDGRVVVSEGRLTDLDEAGLLAEAGRAADAAWGRFAERHGGYAGPPPG